MSIEKLDNGLIASVYGIEPEGAVAIATVKPGVEGKIVLGVDEDTETSDGWHSVSVIEPIIHETLFPEDFEISAEDIPEGSSVVHEILSSLIARDSEDYDVQHLSLFTQDQVLAIVKNVIDEIA